MTFTVIPKAAAIFLFCFPSAASSTIRARRTSCTLVSLERISRSSSAFSSSVNTMGGFNYEVRRLNEAKKISLGVLNPSVFRGRLLSLSSMS